MTIRDILATKMYYKNRSNISGTRVLLFINMGGDWANGLKSASLITGGATGSRSVVSVFTAAADTASYQLLLMCCDAASSEALRAKKQSCAIGFL